MIDGKKTDNAGYSLAELVVVLAIAGIVVLFSWPGMTGCLAELYLRQAANQLVRDIRFVQQQAMDNPAGGWKISFYTSRMVDGRQTDTQGWATLRFINNISCPVSTRPLPSGCSFLGSNFANQEIRFSELGVPLSAGHAGIRNSRGHALYIIVAPVTGKARIDTHPP